MLIAVKKSKFIVSFVIIFGTLSFPIQSYTTQLDLHCGSKNWTPTKFSNNFNTYWPISIIFCSMNSNSNPGPVHKLYV